MQIPKIPEWAGRWTANNTTLNNGKNKVKVNSHSEITKTIEEGIRQTQEWQQQWEDEKVTRQQQLQIDTSEKHKWSLMGMGSTLAVVLIVIAIILWCVVKQRANIASTLMGITHIGEIAASAHPGSRD